MAQTNYGFRLASGHGVEEDQAAAARHFQMAADPGHARGQFNYGFRLANGLGVAKDYAAAARYLRMAADQGYAEARSHYRVVLMRVPDVDEVEVQAIDTANPAKRPQALIHACGFASRPGE